KRQTSSEQISGLAPGYQDRQVPAALFEVTGNGHDHDVELLRQVLRPAGTVLQVDVEFVEIRRAAVDDDEPRVIFRLRIEVDEAQGRDVPIEVVAAKTLDDTVCLVAELLSGKRGDVARIEGAAVGSPSKRGDRSSAVRQTCARA